MMAWLDMGGYAAYVWPAYGLTVLAVGGLLLLTLARRHRSMVRLAELETREGDV